MEIEYTKKDLKKSPEVKTSLPTTQEGIYPVGENFGFLDPKGNELEYTSKKNAKIAYERLYGRAYG